MVTNCINNSKCMQFFSIFTRVWAKKNCCQAGRRFAFFCGVFSGTSQLVLATCHRHGFWIFRLATWDKVDYPKGMPMLPKRLVHRSQSQQSINGSIPQQIRRKDSIGPIYRWFRRFTNWDDQKKTANKQLDIFPTGAWPSQKETLHLKANTTETFTQTTSSGTLKLLYSKLKIINLDFPKIREPHQLHAGWCQLVHPKIQLTSWIVTMRHDQTCAWKSRPIYPFFSPNSILGSLKSERIQLIHCRSNESPWNI